PPLPRARDGLCLSLPLAVRTMTKRPGEAFGLVGPHFNASYPSRSVLSLTGLSSHPLWVRASRKSWSMHRSERVMAYVLVVGKHASLSSRTGNDIQFTTLLRRQCN